MKKDKSLGPVQLFLVPNEIFYGSNNHVSGVHKIIIFLWCALICLGPFIYSLRPFALFMRLIAWILMPNNYKHIYNTFNFSYNSYSWSKQIKNMINFNKNVLLRSNNDFRSFKSHWKYSKIQNCFSSTHDISTTIIIFKTSAQISRN